MASHPQAPSARPYEPGEAQADADTAHALDQRVKDGVRRGREALWDVAEACYEFHAIRGWEHLGYEHQADWCNDPEVGMSTSTFHRFVSNWRDLAIARKVDSAKLKALDQSKVQTVLPSIKRGDAPLAQILADVEVLGRSDLVEKYVRKEETPTEEEEVAPTNPDDDTPVSGEEVLADLEGTAEEVEEVGGVEENADLTREAEFTADDVADLDARIEARGAALAEARACLRDEYPLSKASRQRYQKALLTLARTIDPAGHYHVGQATADSKCPACQHLLHG